MSTLLLKLSLTSQWPRARRTCWTVKAAARRALEFQLSVHFRRIVLCVSHVWIAVSFCFWASHEYTSVSLCFWLSKVCTTLLLVEPGMYFIITFFPGESSISSSAALFLGKRGVYLSNNVFCVKHSFISLICSCMQQVAVALCCCCQAANKSINMQQFYTNCIGRNNLLYEKLAVALLIEKFLASHGTRSSMTIFARAHNSTFHSSKTPFYIKNTSKQKSVKWLFPSDFLIKLCMPCIPQSFLKLDCSDTRSVCVNRLLFDAM